MPYVNINIKNKIATGDNSVIVCGNSDYVARFTFDAEWNAYSQKTMRVIYGNNSYYEVLFTGTEASIPAVNDTLGVKIGVYAGNLETSTPAYFDTKKSILCGSGTHATPPTDVYNQILQQMNNKQDKLIAGTNITIVDNVISAIGGGFGAAWGQITGNIQNQTDLKNALDNKVDKVQGKGLSTNDYTNADKTKVANAITEHQSLANYYNKTETDNVVQTMGNTKVNTADIINDTTHTDTNKPLSANMGKDLQDQVNNLKARGRFLSLWDCLGYATTTPTVVPYEYKTGDYFIVGLAYPSPQVNYRPSGSSYNPSTPSTVVETNPVAEGDTYIYDGTNWIWQKNTQQVISFSQITGNATDNTSLFNALQGKLNIAQTIADEGKIPMVNALGMLELASMPDFALKSWVNQNAVAKAQGVAQAGKYLTVGADGNVTLANLPLYNGGVE